MSGRTWEQRETEGGEAIRSRSERARRHSFVQAVNHPLRVQILASVTNREHSPAEMTRMLGEEIGKVNYHFKRLEKMGYIELVRERPVRGSVEHFYRATQRPWFPAEEWERLDPSVRSVASKWTVDRLIDDMDDSLNAGIFDDRGDRHLSRSPIALDEEGWRKVNEILEIALDEVLEESAASAGRMTESGESPVSAVIGMVSFEVPAERG